MEFLRAKAGQIFCGKTPILLRGMGLGGWLLPEGYMWKFYTKCDRPRRIEALIERLCGENYAKAFWRRYYETYITQKDIIWIKEQGFNSVRLPLNARHLFQITEDGSVCFQTETLRYVDECIAWCREAGIYLLLDMHAAPGGQTGQNIDDSEADAPALFTDEKNQELLVAMWRLLALRYQTEPAVGGYDLLNEPLPKWNSRYNNRLLPLYRRLIAAIRAVDQQHIIILEGLHWATDFSVFQDMTPSEAADNLVLQFHKYWSDPDEESLACFLDEAKRLDVPLWMGEGGENNCQWYAYVFGLYERLGIGWCFWSYKKMDCENSPVSFAQPAHWQQILDYLDGAPAPQPETAREIFDDFFSCIGTPIYHQSVINALFRRPPVELPAGAFDLECISGTRQEGAHFRKNSRATLLFADGHTGKADWCRYGGEAQPDDQRILLRLRKGDAVGYHISCAPDSFLNVSIRQQGTGNLTVQGYVPNADGRWQLVPPADSILWLSCVRGENFVESLMVTCEEKTDETKRL